MYLDLFLSFLFTFTYLSGLIPVSQCFKRYSFILCFNQDLYFASLWFLSPEQGSARGQRHPGRVRHCAYCNSHGHHEHELRSYWALTLCIRRFHTVFYLLSIIILFIQYLCPLLRIIPLTFSKHLLFWLPTTVLSTSFAFSHLFSPIPAQVGTHSPHFASQETYPVKQQSWDATDRQDSSVALSPGQSFAIWAIEFRFQPPPRSQPVVLLQGWVPTPLGSQQGPPSLTEQTDIPPVSLSLPLPSQTTVPPVQKTKDCFPRASGPSGWGFSFLVRFEEQWSHCWDSVLLLWLKDM